MHPWLIHVSVCQKPLQYCKVISLQLNFFFKERDKRGGERRPYEEGGRDRMRVLSFSYLTDKKTESWRGREEVEVEVNSCLLAWALDLNPGLSDTGSHSVPPLWPSRQASSSS